MAAAESDLFDSSLDDLVISILSKLSSSAGCPSDFVNVLMTCKRLNRLALHSLVLSKGSSKMLPIKAKNSSESARRFLKLCADAGNAEARCALLLLEEEKRIFSEELEKLGKAIEEDLANQYFDKEIQIQIFSKDLLVTLDKDLGFEMLQTGGLEGVTAMNSSGSQNLEMIQTGGLEGLTAVNSSSFGALGNSFERAEDLKRKREEELNEARQGKRPATAYATPSRPPIGGFMAEARQNYGQSVAALAIQGSLFSTNEGTQIQSREAAHDKEASTSSWAPPQVELRNFTGDELGLGSKNKFQVKDDEAFCEEPGVADMLKDSREKEEQEFMEELKKLEEVLMKDGTNEVFDMDSLLDFPDLEMWIPYMTGYCEGELQYSTIWTTELTAVAMNSTATGEPHHDPLGMEGGTTAAGSSGDPTTQSSPHNEKV